eukprot:gene7679-606_t
MSLKTWHIAIIAAGGAVAVMIVVAISIACYRFRRRQRHSGHSSSGRQPFVKSNGSTNPHKQLHEENDVSPILEEGLKKSNPIFGRHNSFLATTDPTPSVMSEHSTLPLQNPSPIEQEEDSKNPHPNSNRDNHSNATAEDATHTRHHEQHHQQSQQQHCIGEEKPAADDRAAKLAAMREARLRRKKDEWAMLEESLSIIDRLYRDVVVSDA